MTEERSSGAFDSHPKARKSRGLGTPDFALSLRTTAATHAAAACGDHAKDRYTSSTLAAKFWTVN